MGRSSSPRGGGGAGAPGGGNSEAGGGDNDQSRGTTSGGGGDPATPFDPYDDPMAPPREPCECWCLHCERTFMSSGMWFQRVVGARDGFPGFWMCPTPNCSGAGFGFDIFPTDPDHPVNAGWHDADEEDEQGYFDADAEVDADGSAEEWDPAEPGYRQLDREMEDLEDEDLDGEEWKYGLAPGERPETAAGPAADPDAMAQAWRQWEEERKRFDMPDERPRVLDWTELDDRPGGGTFNDDDIPF